MRTAVVLMIVICAGGSGCSSQPSGPAVLPNETLIEASANAPFQLRAGQIASLNGGVMLAFRRVTDDSRCASDVQCVWSGDATVHIDVAVGRAAWSARSLHTHVEPRAVVHGAYRINLLELAPQPVSTRSITSGEYVATFEVTQER